MPEKRRIEPGRFPDRGGELGRGDHDTGDNVMGKGAIGTPGDDTKGSPLYGGVDRGDGQRKRDHEAGAPRPKC